MTSEQARIRRELGVRLTEALNEHAPEGVRGDKKALQQEMAARLGSGSRQGTSYPAVLGYFAGEGTPSLEWLHAAAEVLRVRTAWLATGEGPPTEEQREQDARIAMDIAAREEAMQQYRSEARALMEGLTLAEKVRAESFVLFRGDSGVLWHSFVATLRRLAAASPRPLAEDETLDLAAALSAHLLAVHGGLHLQNDYPRPEGFSARRALPVAGSPQFQAFAVSFLNSVAGTVPEGQADLPEGLTTMIRSEAERKQAVEEAARTTREED